MFKKILACLLALTLIFTSVNFSEVEAAKKYKLNKTKTFVRIGSPVKLKVKNAKKKKIKWKSSNKKIATVSKKGVVKGKNYGKCNVTAKIGKKKLKCRVIVTHKVAKVVTAKTINKIATKLKSKGRYNSTERCYEYVKRIKQNDNVYVAKLIYYPKTNHVEVYYSANNASCIVEFHVGDKQYCKFNGFTDAQDIYVEGKFNKPRFSDEGEAVIVIDSNVPEIYWGELKTNAFGFVEAITYMFDEIAKDLKTNVYSEDMGFPIPLSYFK